MYNSVPVYMQDKTEELIRFNIMGGHYIFTDENTDTAAKILSGKPVSGIGAVRRISK